MTYAYTYNKTLVPCAQSNKKKPTEAENTLWYHLRNKTLNGNKFRRQYPIHNYILDFYCTEKKLAIELDGSQHLQNKLYDKKRTIHLESISIRVIRFWDSEVLKDINSVLEKTLLELEKLKQCNLKVSLKQPHPTLLLKGEGNYSVKILRQLQNSKFSQARR